MVNDPPLKVIGKLGVPLYLQLHHWFVTKPEERCSINARPAFIYFTRILNTISFSISRHRWQAENIFVCTNKISLSVSSDSASASIILICLLESTGVLKISKNSASSLLINCFRNSLLLFCWFLISFLSIVSLLYRSRNIVSLCSLIKI